MNGGVNIPPSDGEADGTGSEGSDDPFSPSGGRASPAGAPRSERKLWLALHTLRRSHGLHFRRQVPIGPYVAAFVCQPLHVIVEAGGADPDRATDPERDAAFLREGYRTVRISPWRIANEWEGVLQTLEIELGLDAAGDDEES